MKELAAEDGMKLSKKYMKAMKKLFKKVDLNKDGEVSVEELDTFLKKKNVAKLLAEAKAEAEEKKWSHSSDNLIDSIDQFNL